MKKGSAFHAWVLQDLFDGIPGITSRSMFGGYGFYLRGTIFALIAEGRLYFKADPASAPSFKERGSKPFAYSSKDRKKVTMSYWELPEDIMEDREALLTWIKRAASIRKTTKKST